MNITTTYEIKEHPKSLLGAFDIRVFINGEPVGSVRALSGPVSDIKQFAAGEIDMAEVRRRWGVNNP